jgi:hypothetical protein
MGSQDIFVVVGFPRKPLVCIKQRSKNWKSLNSAQSLPRNYDVYRKPFDEALQRYHRRAPQAFLLVQAQENVCWMIYQMASEFALRCSDLFEDTPIELHCVAAPFRLEIFWNSQYIYPIPPPDNNVEPTIRNDNFELTQSQAVQ